MVCFQKKDMILCFAIVAVKILRELVTPCLIHQLKYNMLDRRIA
ncbi:hypothetical protein P0136_09630 [Lentisphaerota bacterium ZTH]|nr:hypothetical protein P0136_09630 [Lentisphaerota bacterium ZTH]